MIKAVIFDLDGVLVDAREFHYEALNNSLAKFGYTITREEHLSTFDGLPTRKKLQMLTEKKGLPIESYHDIWKGKQEETIKILRNLTPDYRIIEVLKKLKQEGYSIVVCSNSIRESTKMMLLKRGFMEYVDFYLSNQDIQNPKPSCEIYLTAIIKLGLSPKECVIVEDSHIGRKSALDSGAYLCGVENSLGVTYEYIRNTINEAEETNKLNVSNVKWQNKEMNVLILLAGEGTSFKNAGYTFPKPLVEVNNKPMVQKVVENLNTEGNFIYMVKRSHYEKYNLHHLLNLMTPGCKIIQVENSTEGAACTALLAKEYIDNDKPLVISNSDQFIEWNSNEFFYAMAADECHGGIVTFNSTHPKWSYARMREDGFVAEVAEKKPISNIATAGIYYFQKGSYFVKYAEQMILKNARVNGEFFICPVYNEMVNDEKKIRIFPIKKMWGLGTPEDLRLFLTKYDESNH
ncbi:MAG: HAD-IA family hydrolase [Candidatus Pacearchaeota archaeon]|nr:HAD-IA family hydrolase [Candidatus Pacearchaeota archaeon]